MTTNNFGPKTMTTIFFLNQKQITRYVSYLTGEYMGDWTRGPQVFILPSYSGMRTV